ncbi:hypothetical protein [Ruminococcus sp. Marseille-P6503]|uniref:hypothetical protein n=1 Tax=Ruminococcus sp. Marseille-P6503 TaxID=2364796 RepID=UPI000F52BF1A|nr:hypothetical protein [Ruminococcus sp. Marseille-P6503]
MAISFKNMQLIIDGQDPTEEHLKFINNSKTKRNRFDDISYNFKTEYNEGLKYLWLYVEYENAKIHNDKVYNEDKQCDEPNPRNPYQIEFKHQFFCIYFLSTKVLYLSNIQKKNHLIKYLSDILQKKVEIKNYYKNMDEFSKGISCLKSISFITKDTLFRKKNGIFDAVDNIYGLDYANQIKISVDYGRLSLAGIASHFIKKIKNQEKNLQIQNIVVCGYDDNEVEKTLDVKNYIEAININVEADEGTGLYDEIDVKYEIINKLKENRYV